MSNKNSKNNNDANVNANIAAGNLNSLSSKAVVEKLNVTLANSIVMYQKLHHYHWRVTGEQFFGMHAKFEELYDKFNEVLDDVAERVLTVGGAPVATLKEALQLASVSEDSSVPSGKDMVKAILNDFALQRNQMHEVIEEAEKAGDRGTANLLDGICDELEKTMWMLRSVLK